MSANGWSRELLTVLEGDVYNDEMHTKVEVARASLADDFVVVPVLGRDVLVPPPEFSIRGGNETSGALRTSLNGEYPAKPVDPSLLGDLFRKYGSALCITISTKLAAWRYNSLHG